MTDRMPSHPLPGYRGLPQWWTVIKPDYTTIGQSLPGQTENQRIELAAGERDAAIARSKLKPTLVQATIGQPDPVTVVHQNLQAVTALVGKEIGMVRLRFAKDPDDLRQDRFRSGPHIEWPRRQPQGIDPDHRSQSRNQAAQSPDAWTGQSTLIAALPRRISIRMSRDADSAGANGNCTNAGAIPGAVSMTGIGTRRVGGSIPRSRIHRRT
jgi:hypothetical protein